MIKAMNAIENCRTSKLGGHIDECDNCGHIKISYNSCRKRHCPKCQGLAKETKKKQSWQELLIELTGKDPRKCSCCGVGKMITKEILSKYSGKNMQVKKLAA